MISEFIDRQATNTDLFELEDVLTGEKRQYRIVSKATVTVPGTDLNKATLDPILEAILSAAGIADSGGSASTGYWVKFDDGTMIFYRNYTIQATCTTAEGALYRSSAVVLGDFPVRFTSAPTVVTSMYNNARVNFWAGSLLGTSLTNAGSLFVLSPTSKTNVLCDVRYMAIGRWK